MIKVSSEDDELHFKQNIITFKLKLWILFEN